MEQHDWTFINKPFDLRERLFNFACAVVRVVQFLHTKGPIGKAVSYQILSAGMSAGSNYEEADDGSSAADTLAKRRIVLRELKEVRFRLRVVRHAGILTPAQDPVIEEANELVKIVATLIRKSRMKSRLAVIWIQLKLEVGSWKLRFWKLTCYRHSTSGER